MGTAFKMEDYFAQFEYVAQGSFLAPIASLFPLMSEYSMVFAIGTIILEIMLGIMLVIGSRPKFTSWAFFLLMVFFTVLTGFTYLTGYVPEGVNFFEFSGWTGFNAGNMKVTDCGCFGDFIKLVPKTSFYKDIFLMIPAILFLFMHRQFHRLFTPRIRSIITYVSLAALVLFCLYNSYMNEPLVDFRPFKNGTHVRELRAAEMKAVSEAPVTMVITSKADGKVTQLPLADYNKRWKEFPKDDYTWDQIIGEPAIPKTKLSDFTVMDLDNQDISDAILDESGPTVMIINYDVPYAMGEQTVQRTDTIMDSADSTLPARINTVTTKEAVKMWDADWIQQYKEEILPIIRSAKQENIKTITVFSGVSSDEIRSIMNALGEEFPAAEADDKLLKTMIRSNPGIILWKDGRIVRKFHIATNPDWKKVSKHL